MAKEKQSEYTQKNKEFIFLYEIVGILCILLALISIAKLGIVGKYGMLTFRLLFGDWYFLFLLLLGVLGIYFLFVHHHFTIKNIRYLGIILIVLSIIIISHFSMHEFVINYEGNALKNTLLLYLDYFKNNRPNMMKGGGVIGAILFYILYFLFSKVGTIIICIFTVFIGVVFICKKTVFEFIKIIISTIKNGFGGAKSCSRKIKDSIKKFNDNYFEDILVIKPYSKHCLDNDEINLTNQDKVMTEYVNRTRNALKHLKIIYQNINYIVCNHISVIFIKSYQHINYDVLRITLEKIYNEPFLIRYDQKNDLLIIEINNVVGYSLFMREGLYNSDKKSMELIIGKDDRNNYVECNNNLIIVSNCTKEYQRYLLSLILFFKFKKNINDYNIIMIDLNSAFKDYENIFNEYYSNMNNLSKLKDNLDIILNKLSDNQYPTIDEYNKQNDEKIKIPIIFVNGLNQILNDYDKYKLIEYMIITGKNIGYRYIMSLLDNNINNNEIMKHFDYRLFLKNNLDLTKKYISELMITTMNQEVEGFLKYKNLLIRVSLLMIKDTEIKKLKLNKKR